MHNERGLFMMRWAGFAMLFGLFATPAQAANLIVNGDFETGTLAGWTVETRFPVGVAPDASSFFADNTTTTPLTASPTVGPSHKSWYAVSDETSPSARVLYQSFTTPTAFTTLTLQFDLFVNDASGAGAPGATLDPNVPNQHATADILKAGADPFSTAAGDVVQNFYNGVDGPPAQPYTSYGPGGIFDLTGVLAPNTTYILRFADVSNLGQLNTGVDNVDLEFTAPAATPEPASLVLFASISSSFLGSYFYRRWQRPV
jgi:hypothetical protein